jgi:carbon storage regulator CsrA
MGNMLVLSRQEQEGVKITTPSGEVIRVVVVRVHGNDRKVRLGFEANAGVVIDRDEVSLRRAKYPNGKPADENPNQVF